MLGTSNVDERLFWFFLPPFLFNFLLLALLVMSQNTVCLFLFASHELVTALPLDCSSADLNPIGAVSKHDLREFLQFVNGIHKFSHLQGFGALINPIKIKSKDH